MSSFVLYIVAEIMRALIHAPLKFMILATTIIILLLYFFRFLIVKRQINYKPGSVI